MTVTSGEEGFNEFQHFVDIICGMGPKKEPTNEGSPARLGGAVEAANLAPDDHYCSHCHLILSAHRQSLVTPAGPKKIGTNQTS